jgi:hypothetical protein
LVTCARRWAQLTTHAFGRPDGIVEELRDRDGLVRKVSLMLRPHSAMMPTIKRMAAALELNPLPT